MDESQEDFGKQKKPDLKGYILYDSICMILWERENYKKGECFIGGQVRRREKG